MRTTTRSSTCTNSRAYSSPSDARSWAVLSPSIAGIWCAANFAKPWATSRLEWLAHAAKMRGQLVLDEGAARAVRGGKASLLAAGVTAVRGEFEVGDPVELVGPDGSLVARGFAKFAAHQIPAMLGLSTAQLRASLGEEYARELVHLDDLVVVRSSK